MVIDGETDESGEAIRHWASPGAARVVVVSTQAVDDPWRLIDAGAVDVLAVGPSLGDDVAARLKRWEVVDRTMGSDIVQDTIGGTSSRFVAVLREVVEVALFTDSPVLVTGESGTGKELIARLVHELDPRPDKRRFVVLDCTTVVPTLSGSEFFGHEKGAFTGAVSARDGAFALADGGTLFLDEVGELSNGLQAELLRVVQERTYKRVGSDTWRTTAFRLVCATNRDLEAEVAGGRYRRDLYHRIAAWSCRLPPLRERRDDIPTLAARFLHEAMPSMEDVRFDEAVTQALMLRDYPGNVRELRHLVNRIAARHVGRGAITVGDVPPSERPTKGSAVAEWKDAGFGRAIEMALALGVPLPEIGRAAEEEAVKVALSAEHGSIQRAARRLGITARALQMRRASQHRPRDRRQPAVESTSIPPG